MLLDLKQKESRSYVVLDLESAVLNEDGHRRYQAMERYVPGTDSESRRGYKRHEDPLQTPRWPFQTITTASLILMSDHEQGNVQVDRFITLSAPEHSEREVIEGVFDVLAKAPKNTEIVSWSGMFHDMPLLTFGAMRYGLTLPAQWRWLSFGGNDPARHLDFARTTTGGFKMKPVHLAEVLAALDIPAKMTMPAFAVASHIDAGRWDAVQEACESDAIATALLLARWKKLHDGRAPIELVEERILRSIVRLRAGRSYVGELQIRLDALLRSRMIRAANDARWLAPWLEQDAA